MKKHYRNIDVMKGICILIVIFEHSKWTRAQWLKLLIPFWDRIAIPCFMVISGFVYSRSIEGKSLKEAYAPKSKFKKLKRYLLPFLFVFLIECILYRIAASSFIKEFLLRRFNYVYASDINEKMTLSTIIRAFFNGGYGPGNYYTPDLIQLVLLFPILYRFMKRYGYRGLIYSFFFCLLSELWQYYFHIPNEIYRYLVFRHIMNICFGIYLSLGLYKKNRILNILSMMIGFSYIIAHSYYRWTPFFFNRSWADVCFIPCMFFIPIIAFFIQKEKITCKPLEQIGKASYHIYLTQMIYYNFVKKDIALTFIRNQYLWCFISILLCAFFGYLFYELENKIRSKYKFCALLLDYPIGTEVRFSLLPHMAYTDPVLMAFISASFMLCLVSSQLRQVLIPLHRYPDVSPDI